MHRGFAAELRRVLLITIICVIVGLVVGYLTWTLVAGGALYMGWSLWQIYRLDRWLRAREPGLPPEASGIWGDISDRIYHLQKRQGREKQRLQGLLKRVQDITAALPDGVILLDERGNMTWWNDMANRLLGFQSGDVGKPLIHFVRTPRFVRYVEKDDYREPITMTSPLHAAKRLQFQITRYGQGERLVLVRDITRLHRLEQIRKDFVANVSHEMRTPLTVIKGYLETLLDYPDGLPQKLQKPVHQMQQQTDRMSLLVNDLITLSKLETEDPEQHQAPVKIATLLNTIGNEAQVVGKEQYTVEFNCDTEKCIRGSHKELHSALSNLVVNAIKYSAPKTTIRIRCYENDKGLHIAVTDQGMGIDAKHIPRLTERFYRAEQSRASSTGGTGLGLAIVKHVLLRHDGTLDIQSRVGEGSTFTCSFPPARIVAPPVEKSA